MNTIPSGMLPYVGVAIVVQLVLQVTALVMLIRTPGERVSIGGRKWVWVLIIVLGEWLGAILWFILGRTQAPVDVAAPAAAPGTHAAAADTLYGATAPAATAADQPAVAPPATPPNPAILDDADATPEARANDPEIGEDGTGSGELP